MNNLLVIWGRSGKCLHYTLSIVSSYSYDILITRAKLSPVEHNLLLILFYYSGAGEPLI